MKIALVARVASIALVAPAAAQDMAAGREAMARVAPDPQALRATELGRRPAAEARQGVAVDDRHFYAVANHAIGKYRKRTGARVGGWTGDGGRITHLNSCSVIARELVCAHSNYPQVPMASSVEVFDPATMRHLRSVPLGVGGGSLTWVERRGNRWWAGFANYDARGGEPGRDHRFTHVAVFDDAWRRVGGYRFPDAVLARFAPRSNSGGGFGADGLLYVTGHDAPELYALRVPGEGATLEHVATIAAPLDGQAWAWDRSAPGTLWGITRRAGEVVAMRMPPVATD